MAKFLRLHVRGIRSVGDEDHNVHKIEFLSPCTLISGPNGTGKTTTIEALNYVTTGQMPTQKKASFIHSTDVARKTRVDASVALEFIDVKGRKCTAIRKLVATVGAKNTAQAEEHTLTIKYADGTTQSLNSKVCDFNKAILHHLGVPKAIFKYVIFCHQEDSTWPLSEPKILKMRFDEIFQLTKFVRAQERMLKMSRDFKKDMETALVQQQLYETHIKEKLSAKQIRDDCTMKIVNGKEKLAELKEMKNDGIHRSEELRLEIAKLEKILNSIKNNETERINLVNQLHLVRVQPYSGTMEELEQEIEDVQMGSGGRNFAEERDRINRKIARNSQEKEQLTREKRELESKISSLKAESLHRDVQRKELKTLEANLRKELSMDPNDPFDLEIESAIQTKLEQMAEGTRGIIAEAKEVREELGAAQESFTKIEVELKSLYGERKRLEGEVDNLKTKIKQGENASSGMKELLRKEEVVRKELEALPEVDEKGLKDCKKRRDQIQKELDEVKKQCLEAEKNAEREKEAMGLKKAVESNRKKLDLLNTKHEENFTLFSASIKAPWTPIVTKTSLKLKNDKKTLEQELRNLQLNVQKLETTQQQQKKYEEKLTGQELQLNEDIFDNCCCEPDEVDSKLKNLRQQLKKARKDLAPISAKVDLYDSYIENTQSSGCCPLCDRDFSNKKEINAFTKKLQNMTLSFPTEQEELEKEVAKMEEDEAGLVKAEAQTRELVKVGKELKEIREKGKAVVKEIKEERKQVETKEQELEKINDKIQMVEAIQADVGVMDQLAEQIKEDSRALKMYEDHDDTDEEKRTYAELREDVEAKEKEYRSIVQSGEELQKAASDRNRLQSKLNDLGTHRVSLGETAAQAGAFAEQLEKKKNDIDRVLKETTEKREQDLPEARFHKEEVDQKMKKKDEERKKVEMDMQLKKKDLEQKYHQWVALEKSVKEAGKVEKKIHEQEENVTRLNERFEENQQRQKRFEEDLRTINTSQNKQVTLEDQRQRMRFEKKIRAIDAELERLAESGVTEEQVAEQKKVYADLQNDMRARNNEEVKIFTQIGEFEKQMKASEQKLLQKEIQRAEVNYRDAILETTLLQETVDDLNKYRKCLDVSLIQFHTEKMSAVNVIIDELWRKVYNSTDITTIRIRSDAKSESSSKNCAYDYNVMMVQESGAEIEMRGRCSAGQKMLASLLIRIALAEVFGGLCSMIALDEPTTNLDESKIDGMANVLNDLIEARRGYDECGHIRGREMQMVVITHDERLVNKLTIGCRPEYIYCLGKDEHGVSYLTKRMPNGSEIRVNKQ